jgi:hypothetical protein
MTSSWMLRRAALVRIDGSEEFSASFIRVTRLGELGTPLAVTSKGRTLQRHAKVYKRIILRQTNTWEKWNVHRRSEQAVAS